MTQRFSCDVDQMTVYFDGFQKYENYCKDCGDLRHTSYGLPGKSFDPEFVAKVTSVVNRCSGCYSCEYYYGVKIHRLSIQT